MNEPTLNLLLVDDEDSVRIPLARHLCSAPYRYGVRDFASVEAALQALEEAKGRFDVALIDEVLGENEGSAGLDLVRKIKARYPQIECILFTGWGMQSGLEALHAGAYRYFAKPFNLEELALTIRFAADQKVREREREYLAALVQVSRELTHTTDVEEQLALVSNYVKERLAASTLFVALYEPETDTLQFHSSYDEGEETPIPGRRLGSDPSGWGIAGYVLKTGKEQIWFGHEAAVQQWQRLGIKPLVRGKGSSESGICLPLRVGEKILGVLSLQSYKPDGLDVALLNTVRALANQLAVALENSRLVTETKQKALNLDNLQKLTLAINSTLDLKDVLTQSCQAVVELLGADHSGLVLFDPDLTRGEVFAEYPPTERTIGQTIPVQGIPAEEQLVSHHEVINVPDLQQDTTLGAVREILLSLGLCSILIVPVIFNQKVVGSFSLDAMQSPRTFSEADIEICRRLADQVAVAIENARLIHKEQAATLRMRKQAEGLRVLHEIGKEITSARDVDFIWDSIAQHLVRLVGAKRSLFLLVDTKAKRLIKATGYGYPAEHLQRMTIDEVEAGVSGWVLRNKKAVLIENAQSDPRNTGVALARARDFGTTPLIVAPLLIKDEAIGTLTVANSDGDTTFDEDDKELVVMLAAQAAIAYDTARRMQELELLHKAAEALAAPLEAPQVLRQIVESACEVLQADSSALWSYDDTLNQFRPDELVAYRISRDELEKFRKKVPKQGGTADTVMQRGWVGVPDISDSQMPFAGSSTIALLNSVGVRSFQGVSLTVGNEKLGVLYVNYNQPQHFTLREKKVLKTLASHAALALKKVRLLDELAAALEQVTRARNTAQAVAEVTTLEELPSTLDSIVKGTKDTLGCDVVTLYTYNQERDEFDFPPTMVGVRHKKKVLGLGFVSRDSVLYKIIRLGEPYVTQENANDTIMGSPFSLREGIKAAIGVPLTVGGQKVGVMFVNYRSAHVVTKEDLTNVKLFAQQAAIAIENARLYDAARQRAEKLGAVLNISKTAISSLDLNHILNAACRAVVDLLQVDHSGLVLFDKHLVTARVCAEYPPLGTIGVEFPVQGVPAEEKLVASRQPLMVADVAHETGFDPVRGVLTKLGTCSILLVPILSGGDLLGSFGLDMMQRQRAFTKEEIEICTIFAAQVAVAIEKARQYEQLKQSRETVAAMTAVAWMGIVSGTWRHNLGNNVTIIEDLVKLVRKDLSQGGSHEKIRGRLKEIEEITGDLQDLPMYPLSAEEDVESVTINQLLEDRIRQLEKKERYKEIDFAYRFEIEIAASVRASPEWLRRVIDILIDNAANAMEEVKEKSILFTTRPVSNGVEISITDSGKGIPEGIKSRLFQETFKKKKGEKGSGIGLFLARIIIQTYNGTLTLGSTSPQGTTMVIWLPLENNETVLLVRNEDNQHWEDVLEESLSPDRSLQRCTERETLEKLRRRHFALIIVDAEAVEDAPRLVSAIKARDRQARIVVATASPTWKPAREVLKAGAVDFIRKLSDASAVRVKLEEALQKPLKVPEPEG